MVSIMSSVLQNVSIHILLLKYDIKSSISNKLVLKLKRFIETFSIPYREALSERYFPTKKYISKKPMALKIQSSGVKRQIRFYQS